MQTRDEDILVMKHTAVSQLGWMDRVPVKTYHGHSMVMKRIATTKSR